MQLNDFIDLLYRVDIDDFKRRGRLRPMLDICTAALIMYYPKMLVRFGPSNKVVCKLTVAAEAAKLTYHVDGKIECEADTVLRSLAKHIEDDFFVRNNQQHIVCDAAVAESLERLSKTVSSQQRKAAEDRARFEAYMKESTNLLGHTLRIVQGLQDHLEKVSNVSDKHWEADSSTTDDCVIVDSCKRSALNDTTIAETPLCKKAKVNMVSADKAGLTHALPAQQINALAALKRAPAGKAVKQGNESSKQIKDCLFILHSSGKLYNHRHLDNYDVPAMVPDFVTSKNIGLFHALIRAVSAVWTKTEKAILFMRPSESDKNIVERTTEEIQVRAMKAMEANENSIRGLQPAERRKASVRPGWIGFGGRQKKYEIALNKANIAKAKDATK